MSYVFLVGLANNFYLIAYLLWSWVPGNQGERLIIVGDLSWIWIDFRNQGHGFIFGCSLTSTLLERLSSNLWQCTLTLQRLFRFNAAWRCHRNEPRRNSNPGSCQQETVPDVRRRQSKISIGQLARRHFRGEKEHKTSVSFRCGAFASFLCICFIYIGIIKCTRCCSSF